MKKISFFQANRSITAIARSLILSALTLTTITAQTTVTTVPVGIITWSMPAVTQTSSFFFSLPLLNQSEGVYQVASLTTNTITVTGTPWTAGSLAQSGAPYFVRFISGVEKGRMILVTANTTNSLTVDITDNSSQSTPLNTTGFAVVAADTFEVVAGDTLASIFGDNMAGNPVQLVGDALLFKADTVSIYNKATALYDTYYFNTTNGYWRSSTDAFSKNNLVIYPESTIGINRRAGRPALNFVITGKVPDVAPLIKVQGSKAIYSSTRFPADMTLAQLSLSNWTKSNTLFGADTLSIYNRTTSLNDTYYQKLDGTWRKSGDSVTDQSGYVLGAGTSVILFKRIAVSGAASYVAATMPYALN